MKNLVRVVAGPLLVLAVVTGTLWLLHRELRDYELQDFLDSLSRIPSSALWCAVGLTCLNYLILIGYDLLGVRYLNHRMHWAKVAFGSFLGCAVGNNLGNLLGGSTVRYRLYSAWGLSAVDIVKLVLILSVTFWIGLFAISGVMFIWRPIAIPPLLHLPVATTRPLGVLLLFLTAGYLALCAVGPRGVKIRDWEFSPPPVGLSLMQYLVATLDLMVSAGVLYVLLPASAQADYFSFLTIYLLGLMATLITQVPGGIGVLELLIVVLLQPTDHHDVVGALLAFRAIYFLFPLAIGLLMLTMHEIAVHRGHARDAFSVLGRWAPVVVPRLLTVFVFIAGTVMLFSGATPSETTRLIQLHSYLPFAIVEGAHILGSLSGVFLLVMTRGLQRRTEVAYFCVCALLTVSSMLLVLQGAHPSLAVAMIGLLIVFIPARPYFFRRDVRLTGSISVRWVAAVFGALACTVWLLVFAVKHSAYQHDLWWRFASDATVSRSLRSTLAAVLISLLLLAIRIFRVHEPLPGAVTAAEMDDARDVIHMSKRAMSHLVLVGDKRILFNRQRDGFVMFGTEGGSYVAMGDPVGPESVIRELAWEFWELGDVSGRRTVFYHVDEVNLPMYVELGLAVVKIGEEARVLLPQFDLEDTGRHDLRCSHRQMMEKRYRFETVPAKDVSCLLPELRSVSDAWLSESNAGEKRFSVGSWDDEYLRQNPVAVVRHRQRIVAFTNLWLSAGHEELAMDMMRFSPDSPSETMEFLLTELMLWGKSQGFRWFNLGMAPVSGAENQPHAPVWNELANVAFRHGDHFDDFESIRQYQEKLGGRWRPKYLACPGGLALATVLADVARLISNDRARSIDRHAPSKLVK